MCCAKDGKWAAEKVLQVPAKKVDNWLLPTMPGSLMDLMYRVAQKSKLLILAVNEINASQTRVSFAKFISKLVEKMFDMCSIVPNYSFSILKFFY